MIGKDAVVERRAGGIGFVFSFLGDVQGYVAGLADNAKSRSPSP